MPEEPIQPERSTGKAQHKMKLKEQNPSNKTLENQLNKINQSITETKISITKVKNKQNSEMIESLKQLPPKTKEKLPKEFIKNPSNYLDKHPDFATKLKEIINN